MWFSFNNEGHGLGFEERKVVDENGFTRCGVRVRVKGDIDVFGWRLAADCHQIESALREREREILGRGEGNLLQQVCKSQNGI